MWPRKVQKDTDDIVQSVAYDKISKNDKIDNLIVVYDEASILLFEKPKKKTTVKKVF